jgi:glycerophosphoryl diester phosphodiesterase
MAGAPLHRITFIAFDAELIAETKRAFPDCQALWLYGDHYVPSGQRARWLADRVRELGVDGIDLRYHSGLNARMLAPLREEGRTIYTYTLNRRTVVLDASLLGVDGITTDCPGDARDWLHFRRLRA